MIKKHKKENMIMKETSMRLIEMETERKRVKQDVAAKKLTDEDQEKDQKTMQVTDVSCGFFRAVRARDSIVRSYNVGNKNAKR